MRFCPPAARNQGAGRAATEEEEAERFYRRRLTNQTSWKDPEGSQLRGQGANSGISIPTEELVNSRLWQLNPRLQSTGQIPRFQTGPGWGLLMGRYIEDSNRRI